MSSEPLASPSHASDAGTEAAHRAVMERYGTTGYRWYVLGVILLVYACHSLDRGIPNIVAELVKAEFGLSDAMLGLFTGTFFGVAFAIMGVPMGFISDRVNRRGMLAFVVLVWSGCTALGGFAPVFGLLLISRLGVGAAEAGAAPIAIPMLSDIFEPTRRGLVLGLFYVSVPLGAFVASYGGGWVAQEFGWRAALLLAGAPGLLLALLLFATVKEPERGAFEVSQVPPENRSEAPAFREAVTLLWREPGLGLLVAGCVICGFVAISTGAWLPSFYIRVHGLDYKQVGLVLGIINMVAAAGPPCMGWISDRAARRHPKGPLRVVSLAVVAGLGFGWLAVQTSSVGVSVAALAVFYLLTHAYTPPLYAVLMAGTPARMRGTTMSILQLATNLVGFGIGASWVGLVSDSLGGGAALRHALSLAMVGLLGVAVMLTLSGRLLYGRR